MDIPDPLMLHFSAKNPDLRCKKRWSHGKQGAIGSVLDRILTLLI